MYNSYKNLIVWRKSIQLVIQVYKITENYPKHEKYILVSQIRRCAISIPSNIAEGSKRGFQKEFRRFLGISFGSGAELETQLLISNKLGYINNDEYSEINKVLVEVMKMLNVMIRKFN